MKRLLIAIALSILPVAFLVAQEADTSSVQEAGTAVEAAATEAGEGAAGSGPVPVPELSDKARRYYRSGNWLWLFNWLWRLGLPAILLFSGLSAKIRDVAQKTGRYWFFTIGIYFALFTLIVFVVELPLSYYQSFARPHASPAASCCCGSPTDCFDSARNVGGSTWGCSASRFSSCFFWSHPF
jgi:hypothetical protein